MRNPSSRQLQPIKVTCYSSHSYADRPTSFVWNDERYDINSIERECLEPGEKHLIVRAARKDAAKREKRLHICYHTQEDLWRLKEIQ
jgi:hypothetical protein